MTYDLFSMQSVTERNSSHVRAMINRIEMFHEDCDRKARLLEHECAYCWYMASGLAGQAFTDWTCRACGKPDNHANTATPILCHECADKYGACRRCGADLDLKNRRALERK